MCYVNENTLFMKLCWQELARIVLNVCSEFSGLQIEFILFVSTVTFVVCCVFRDICVSVLLRLLCVIE